MALPLIVGRSVPGGPSGAVRKRGLFTFGKQGLPGGALGAKKGAPPAGPRSERPPSLANHRSKKSYAGSINGIGRAGMGRIAQPLGPKLNHPAGPGKAVFPTQLPKRGAAAASAVAGRPGLLGRVAARMKRAVGF